MVYSGKIYETDGANAIAVHEADAIRPLAPIPHAPSLRIFRSDLQPQVLEGDESEQARFFYGNPMCLVGASQLINYPDAVKALGFYPLVAAILVADAYQVDVEDADDLILGVTLLNMLVSKDRESIELRSGGIGSSHDIGGAIGPVLTTPDELDDHVVDAATGKRYGLNAVVRVNGVERMRGNLSDLPFTLAEAISSASQTCTLKSGDIIALGAVATSEGLPILLDPGDEVQLAVENLGAISLKLSLLQ
jgi:2-keto-4-pentenoate hydratase/2-oxohepta-3-ene-1,7-dioic acid hydratase in catechol pathway